MKKCPECGEIVLWGRCVGCGRLTPQPEKKRIELVPIPSSDGWAETIYEVRNKKYCVKCRHRWDLHHRVEERKRNFFASEDFFEMKLVCDGEAFPCECVRVYSE